MLIAVLLGTSGVEWCGVLTECRFSTEAGVVVSASSSLPPPPTITNITTTTITITTTVLLECKLQHRVDVRWI